MKKKLAKKFKKQSTARKPQIAFDLVMNFQCELRAEMDLPPLPHWRQTKESPKWVKNICVKLRRTILKPICKLRPSQPLNWRHYGRIIGFIERYKVFLSIDVPAILKAEGFDQISEREWQRIRPLLGEDSARAFLLRVLGLPKTDKTPLHKLIDMAVNKHLAQLENIKQSSFLHVAQQDAKKKALFMKGLQEGYAIFLNAECEFTGDDRRADIHLELIAWQYDIEKMRRSVLQKYNKHLVVELKKLPEFKNKSEDWFKDVFKKIAFSIGPRGRPPAYCRA